MVRTSKIIEQQPANARYFYNPGIIFKAPIFPKDYTYTVTGNNEKHKSDYATSRSILGFFNPRSYG